MKVAHLICALLGHQYKVQQVFSSACRNVYCPRCGCEWGMHDGVQVFVPWDGDLEQLHGEVTI